MSEKPILIYAEDNDSMRRTAAMLFEMNGFEVKAFPDGQQALDALQQMHAEGKAPNALLTDGNMPHLDGGQLLRGARALFPDLPLVMGTARSDDTGFKSAAADTGATIIEKPFGIQTIRDVFAPVLAASQAAEGAGSHVAVAQNPPGGKSGMGSGTPG
jgi:two-component system cell cycle sensor histidine kinase/response regulator CckA